MRMPPDWTVESPPPLDPSPLSIADSHIGVTDKPSNLAASVWVSSKSGVRTDKPLHRCRYVTSLQVPHHVRAMLR